MADDTFGRFVIFDCKAKFPLVYARGKRIKIHHLRVRPVRVQKGVRDCVTQGLFFCYKSLKRRKKEQAGGGGDQGLVTQPSSLI